MNIEILLSECELKENTEIFSSTYEWINNLLKEYVIFFKKNYAIDIEYKWCEDKKDPENYYNAFAQPDRGGRKAEIGIGIGLLKLLSHGIVVGDKDVIDKLTSPFIKNDKSFEYQIATQYIFISAAFFIINHEIVHAIFNHSRLNQCPEGIKSQEIDADCCGGSLLGMVYTNLFNNLKVVLNDCDNKEQITAILVSAGIIYGMHKFDSIFNGASEFYCEFKIRALHAGLSFSYEIFLGGHMIDAVLNNIAHIYCNFFDADIVTFNKNKLEVDKDIFRAHRRMQKRVKLLKYMAHATPDA